MFEKALAVILRHEGGYVNHLTVELNNQLCYGSAWSTLRNSHAKSTSHSKQKASAFIGRIFHRTRGDTDVPFLPVRTRHMLAGYVTRTTFGSARARTCRPPCGISAQNKNALNAARLLMAREVGPSASLTIGHAGAVLFERSALMHSVGSVCDAGAYSQTSLSIFTTKMQMKNYSRQAMRWTRFRSKPSQMRSRNASFFAPIAIG